MMARIPKNRPRWQDGLVFWAYRFIRLLARILPERLSFAMGRGIGLLAYYALAGRQRTVVADIQVALHLPEREAARLARESGAALGLTGAEFLRFSGRHELLRKRISFQGEEHLRHALAAGRGVIILHAHIGNWELCGQAMCLAGYRLHPVVKVQTSGRVYEEIDRERRQSGMVPITRGFSLREMLRVLRRGECVLIMPDQHASKGVIVPFFGRPASTARGIPILARLSGAPVVPVFIYRVRPGYHEIRIHPELEMARTGDEQLDTATNLARINKVLENAIMEAPAQWFWLHKRWKVGFNPGMGGSDP